MTTDYPAFLAKIAKELVWIDPAEYSKAEKNIMRHLEQAGIVRKPTEKNGLYQLV